MRHQSRVGGKGSHSTARDTCDGDRLRVDAGESGEGTTVDSGRRNDDGRLGHDPGRLHSTGSPWKRRGRFHGDRVQLKATKLTLVDHWTEVGSGRGQFCGSNRDRGLKLREIIDVSSLLSVRDHVLCKDARELRATCGPCSG